MKILRLYSARLLRAALALGLGVLTVSSEPAGAAEGVNLWGDRPEWRVAERAQANRPALEDRLAATTLYIRSGFTPGADWRAMEDGLYDCAAEIARVMGTL